MVRELYTHKYIWIRNVFLVFLDVDEQLLNANYCFVRKFRVLHLLHHWFIGVPGTIQIITFCFVFEIFFRFSSLYIIPAHSNIVAFYLIHKMLRVFLFWLVNIPHCMVVNIIGDKFNLCSGTFFHHIKSHVWKEICW